MIAPNFFNDEVTIYPATGTVIKRGKTLKMKGPSTLAAAQHYGLRIIEAGVVTTIYPEPAVNVEPTIETEPVVESSPFDSMTPDEQAVFSTGLALLVRWDEATARELEAEFTLDTLYDFVDCLAGSTTAALSMAIRQAMVEWLPEYEYLVLGGDSEPMVEPAPETPSLMTFPDETLAMVETEAVDQAGSDQSAYDEYMTADHFVPIAPPKRMPMPPASVLDDLVEVKVGGDNATILYLHNDGYRTKTVSQHKLPNRFWVALKDHGFAIYAPQGYGTCRAFHKTRYDQYLASQVMAPMTPTIAVSPPPEGWVLVTGLGYMIGRHDAKPKWHGFKKAKGWNKNGLIAWLRRKGMTVRNHNAVSTRLVGDLSKVT